MIKYISFLIKTGNFEKDILSLQKLYYFEQNYTFITYNYRPVGFYANDKLHIKRYQIAKP